jgi:hypothetical protein
MTTDNIINIVGLSIIAFLIWFFQIYRPRKLSQNPNDLTVKPFMTSRENTLLDIITKEFGKDFRVLANVRFDDFLFSPTLSNKPEFKNLLQQMKSPVLLISKATHEIVLSIDLDDNNEKKVNFLTGANIPCVILDNIDNENEVISVINEAMCFDKGEK